MDNRDDQKRNPGAPLEFEYRWNNGRWETSGEQPYLCQRTDPNSGVPSRRSDYWIPNPDGSFFGERTLVVDGAGCPGEGPGTHWVPISLTPDRAPAGLGEARPDLSDPSETMGSCPRRRTPVARETLPRERLEVLFEELSELAGQRNAIDGRIVEIAAEMDRDELCGSTGARSVAALVAWKIGSSSANAHTITAIANRSAEFPRCVAGLREGRLSLDQVGVIAERAADGSDEHYAELAEVATVSQLRTAIKLEPRPEPDPQPEPTALDHQNQRRALHHLEDHPAQTRRGEVRCGAAVTPRRVDRRLETRPRRRRAAHRHRPPLPGAVDAFMRLVEAGWDADAARRPHGQHTTVVDARRRRRPHRRTASGPAAVRRRTPLPDL